jgi:hypothetical protein
MPFQPTSNLVYNWKTELVLNGRAKECSNMEEQEGISPSIAPSTYPLSRYAYHPRLWR